MGTCGLQEQLVFQCLDNGHPKQEGTNFIHLTGLHTAMDFRSSREITANRVLPRISATRIRNMLQHTSAMVRKFGFGAPMSLSVSFCH
ncbi:hypothetical protein NEUTE2DRAFT_153285 [Neurospora tetrasperma FGSC 2509]|nr:hypothetical protein NEUTE2DRAFT_153285 [Neurospora tetrasperma FGSC 2509]